MSWPQIIGSASAALVNSLGEDLTIRAVDGSNSTTLRGIYDRRAIERDINGTHGIDADYRIGVLEAELPAWVQPSIDSVGVEVDIRDDVLRVNELHPDGQGVVVLVCRAR